MFIYVHLVITPLFSIRQKHLGCHAQDRWSAISSITILAKIPMKQLQNPPNEKSFPSMKYYTAINKQDTMEMSVNMHI